jgi:hypothetical protein
MSRRVRVHQFILTELTRPRSLSWRACDLFGVSHRIDTPEDTEFPYRVTRMQVFARFYLEHAKPTEFLVRVKWLQAPGGAAQLVGMFGPFTVPFAHDATARDCSFSMNNIQLQGVGLHRVELLRERQRGLKAGTLARIAATYFFVER